MNNYPQDDDTYTVSPPADRMNAMLLQRIEYLEEQLAEVLRVQRGAEFFCDEQRRGLMRRISSLELKR